MNELSPKKLRLFELLIVVLVPLLPSLVSSLYIFSTKDYYDRSGTALNNYGLVAGNIRHLLAISLLLYVLYRQGRRVEDIGLKFSWTDLPIGIGLFIIAYFLRYFIYKAGIQLFPHADVKAYNTSSLYGVFFLSFLYAFINPFFEELIVRAYAMTEIEFLSNSKAAAIIISVLFQSSYHLYQGLFPALMTIPIFLVYALYFSRYRLIMPVIIAHLIADMWAMIHHVT